MSLKKEFSIQEKMHLALNHATKLFTRSQGIVIGCFLVLMLTIPITLLVHSLIDVFGTLVIFQECETNYAGILENLDQSCREFIPNSPNTDLTAIISALILFYDTTMVLVGLAILILGAMVAWFFVKGRKVEKEFRNIKNKFLRESYYFVLQTSLHKNENIADEFLEICEDIFPELKEKHQYMSKKGKKWYEVEKKINDVILDILVDTNEGKFIVETSEKTCSYEKIDNTLKIIQSKFKNESIFRVVFLAKDYDKIFYEQDDKESEKLKKLKDYNIQFDLILFTENSFNFLKLA